MPNAPAPDALWKVLENVLHFGSELEAVYAAVAPLLAAERAQAEHVSEWSRTIETLSAELAAERDKLANALHDVMMLTAERDDLRAEVARLQDELRLVTSPHDSVGSILAAERAAREQVERSLVGMKGAWRIVREKLGLPEESPDDGQDAMDALNGIANLRASREAAERDVDALRLFAADMFEISDWPDGGDIDMFDFQEAAEARGLLVRVRAEEPCGENCGCVEWGEFPRDCLRKTHRLTAIDAARAAGKEGA